MRAYKKWGESNSVIGKLIRKQNKANKNSTLTWTENARRNKTRIKITTEMNMKEIKNKIHAYFAKDNTQYINLYFLKNLDIFKIFNKKVVKTYQNQINILKLISGNIVYTNELKSIENNKIPIETGCICCNRPDNESLEHLLFSCPAFDNLTEKELPGLNNINLNNEEKTEKIIKTKNYTRIIIKYIDKILSRRRSCVGNAFTG